MSSPVIPASSTAPRSGYRELLRTRGAWTFVLPGFVARQPFAMLGLSILLLVRHTTGSYGVAGAVAAVAGVAVAAGAPLVGRVADHHGQRAVLIPVVIAHALAGAALTALALVHAPLWALIVAAAATGATAPQIGSMVRGRWVVTLGDSPLLDTAAAFESVIDEFTFVVGPLLATVLCTAVHPAAGLIAEALLTALGGVLFATRTSSRPPARGRAPRSTTQTRHRSVVGVAGGRVLVVAYLGIGSVFGGLQVSMTAFAESIRAPALSGLLYGAFAAGNMLSALAVGAVTWRIPAQRRILLGYGALAVVTSGMWLVHSALLLAVLSLVAGMCVALPLITGYPLIAGLVPAGAHTEAFAWLGSAVALGSAAAAVAAGQLEDRAWAGAGFLVPAIGTGLALVCLLALRSKLLVRTESAI